MKKSSWGWILAFVFLVVIFVETIALVVLAVSSGEESVWADENSVVVIKVEDLIVDARKITERFEKYREDEDVKAIVLRMETPGGAVGASQEVAAAVRKLRVDYGKKVVTSIQNLGASGGYYIAVESDRIVANPGSIVGSIGVILEHMTVNELTDRLGIKFDAIKSGPFKDAGTITRPMTKEERRVLQEMVNDAYEQFRGTVLERRRAALARAAGVPITDTPAIAAALDAIADGRVLTGKQGLEAGLVDRLGGLEDAIDEAARLSGIAGKPNVIYDKPKKKFDILEEMFGDALAPVRDPAARGGLWYLYKF
ncbi:MAG: signal peptide peptidase SppA [Candidatus Hydrogenedentota bacterium]|nr:MAG: signal peptide peptidase SppA [Candidatus Hydrogenedentota bacterium]